MSSPHPESKDDEDRKGGEGKKEGGEEKGKEEKGQEPFRPSKKAIFITVVILAVLITGGVFYWLHARQFVTTDDAYTTGHVHEISARISSTVVEVRVDDNQTVNAGDLLVRLDPSDYEAALQRAQAGVAQAEASVEAQQTALGQNRAGITVAEAKIDQTRAQVSESAAQLQKAQLDFNRISGLYTKDMKAVAKADVDAATASLDAARSAVEAARANQAAAVADAESSRANLEAAQAQIAVAKASANSARAALLNAQLQLSYCQVVAPVGGKVARKTVETGQQLQPGQALMAVVPQDVWVVANLKETQLEAVQIGQRVEIKIDALKHERFYGSVHSIQEGSGATFSLLPPDNATGNFTKIVQRVPVKIVFDPESIRDFREKIVPGLSVEPHIDLNSLRGNQREPKRMERERKQNDEQEGRK